MNTLAMWMPGMQELLIIAFVALLIFGKKLPEVARGMGRSVVEFKKGLRGVQDEVDQLDSEVDREVEKQIQKKDPAQIT